ncbi:MAG: hypothetical protein Q3W96_06345 [Dysosmobacter sp.]|uniref:hypothetical protein n=1 Tax=Dysosmobacter sp. TaxID=2591382 RepID=UPI00283CA5FE|nr:hypothetical protein [Dysosmobacter sp.]MDR3983044.1 hypothetical protein [Dysosmobacter sp.]
MRPKKTEFIGFRTDPKLKEELEKIAEKNDIPVSQLITKILKEVIEFDRTDKSAGNDICNNVLNWNR